MADQTTAPDAAPVESMEEEEEMDMASVVKELMEGYKKLSERMSAVENAMGGDEEEEEVPASEPTENSELDALRIKVSLLERTNALKDAEIKVRSVLPTAPMQEVTDLAESIVDNADRGARLLSLAERSYKAEATPTTNTVQQPLGKPGQAPTGPVDFAEAWDGIAAELGTTDVSSITRVLTERYPHLAGQPVFGG